MLSFAQFHAIVSPAARLAFFTLRNKDDKGWTADETEERVIWSSVRAWYIWRRVLRELGRAAPNMSTDWSFLAGALIIGAKFTSGQIEDFLFFECPPVPAWATIATTQTMKLLDWRPFRFICDRWQPEWGAPCEEYLRMPITDVRRAQVYGLIQLLERAAIISSSTYPVYMQQVIPPPADPGEWQEEKEIARERGKRRR